MQGTFEDILKVYRGRRRFMLTARSYSIDRTKSPYSRLSATLLIACSNPFLIEAGDEPILTAQAVLIAPKVKRKRTIGDNSDLLIFDIPLGSPEFAALASKLSQGQVQPLEIGIFNHLFPILRKAGEDTLSIPEFNTLFTDVVQAICGSEKMALKIDPRIQQALVWLDERPLSEIDTEQLASHLSLSVSRLRHLFKKETGCSLGHYARWIGLWHAMGSWEPGKSLTDIAMNGGFHDLSHLNRAYNEALGMTPSSLVESEHVKLIRCF